MAYRGGYSSVWASTSAARTDLGLVIGTNVQAWDAQLDSLAAFTAGDITNLASYAAITPGAFADDLLVATSQANAQSILGLVIGTNVQAYDAQLADVAGVTPTANTFLGGNGSNLVMRTAAEVKTSLGYYTSGDSPTFGTVTLTAGTISTTPSSGTDIANKTYVDSIAAGLRDFKDSVRVATAASLPAYSRSGNVITAAVNGALAAVDGVTLVAGNRLLLKNGAAGADNGIYEVTTVGDASNPYVLTRTTDADTSAEVTSGMYCYVSAGTANAGTAWVLSTADPITLNTTSLSFTQFSGAGALTAGSGISISGNTVSVANDGITNAMVNSAAAIAYSKLSLALSIVNADISASAAIAYSKLSIAAGDIVAAKLNADVAGNGLASSSGVLSVNVDGSSIEISSDTLQVKALGITNAMLAGSIAYSKLSIASGDIVAAKLAADVAGGGLTSTVGVLAVGAGNGITVSADAVAVADALSLVTSLTTPKITNSGPLFETGIEEFSATGTVASTSLYVVLSGTSTYTLNLPAGATGRVLKFKKVGSSGTVTLDGSGAETIDGATTFAVGTQYMSFTLVWTGLEWSIF